jgi:hypothetical protein
MRCMPTNTVTNIWFGEVVQKGIATWLHGLLQAILANFFYKFAYASGSEIDLRIDPNWQLRPDVTAALEIEQPYPTKPVDIVAEVLSNDPMIKVFENAVTMPGSAFLKFFV